MGRRKSSRHAIEIERPSLSGASKLTLGTFVKKIQGTALLARQGCPLRESKEGRVQRDHGSIRKVHHLAQFFVRESCFERTTSTDDGDVLESGAGEDIENMFGDIVFLENGGRCEKHTSDVERDVSIAYESEVGDLVKGGCGWIGGMLGVPMHEGECGNAMRGRGYGWVECRKGASGCKQEVCVVLEEGREGEGERVRDRGGRGAPDVDVAKEAETRVSSGLVELVRAVLGCCEQM